MVDLHDPSKGELAPQAEASGIQPHSSVSSFRDRSISVASTTSQGRHSLGSSNHGRNPRDSLQHRIIHLSELLRVEKANQDDNTSCYVELVSKADREKAPSIRQAFERINQRTSANIAHLEQRLQDCLLQLKKLEQKTATTQDGTASTASTASTLSSQQQFSTKSTFSRAPYFSLPRFRSARDSTIEEIHIPPTIPSEESFPAPEVNTKPFLDEPAKLKLKELKKQLAELKGAQKSLEEEWHNVEKSWKDEKWEMMELLQEEKKRHYNLEVQVNDVIQVNLNEITNLKHDLACTEEKMVYQSYERSRDIWEVLDSYQTRLTKLETQQQAQQQEAMDLPQASVYKLYGQLINLLLTVVAILLVCVSTVSAFTLPLVRTPWRAMTTLAVVTVVVLVWNSLPDSTELPWATWWHSA